MIVCDVCGEPVGLDDDVFTEGGGALCEKHRDQAAQVVDPDQLLAALRAIYEAGRMSDQQRGRYCAEIAKNALVTAGYPVGDGATAVNESREILLYIAQAYHAIVNHPNRTLLLAEVLRGITANQSLDVRTRDIATSLWHEAMVGGWGTVEYFVDVIDIMSQETRP